MSISILEKKDPKVLKIQAKQVVHQAGMLGQKAQVGAIIDVSGSMSGMFRTHPSYGMSIVEGLFTRVMGLALNFDDNGTVPVIALDDKARVIDPELTPANIDTYVKQYVQRLVGGSTNYAPSINAALDVTAPGDVAVFFCFTDGQNYDHSEAARALVEASQYPIFFQWFGIYTDSREKTDRELERDFPFLAQMDNLSGRNIDNAGFAGLNLELVTEDKLWAAMLKEFPQFVKKAQAQGMLPWNPANDPRNRRGAPPQKKGGFRLW